MHTETVIHKISKEYRVIEYQVIDNNEIVEVYFKVSYLDENEFEGTFDGYDVIMGKLSGDPSFMIKLFNDLLNFF